MDGNDVKNITAGDIMTKNIVSVTEESDPMEIINLLVKKHLVRLPVVRNGKLVGVVARRDIIFAFIQASKKPPNIF